MFLVELWERFGFYGMAALMVLFMVQALGYGDAHANLAWGALSALVYAVPVLGGWVGDRWIGSRRAMLAGTVVLACGYALLAVAREGHDLLFGALSLVAVGNGLFKPNAANLVRRIYDRDPARIDSAFTMYYMAVNVGSTLSMLATPWVQQIWGWHAAFAVCAGGLLFGLLNYACMRRALGTLGSDADHRPLRAPLLLAVVAGAAVVVLGSTLLLRHVAAATWCVLLVAAGVAVAWARLTRLCAPRERGGMIAAAVLTLLVALFIIFYQQMSTSLTLFALRNVEGRMPLPGFGSWRLLPAQFQALNAVWIMLLGPLLAWTYACLARGRGDLSIGGKFALGFAAAAAGFGLILGGCRVAEHGMVPGWFLVGGYGLLSLGELLISGLGLAAMTRYVPARMSGFVMGSYFALLGAAMYAGSLVANIARVPAGALADAQASLHAYVLLFGRLALLALLACALSLAVLPLLRRLVPPSAVGASPGAAS
ncbi:MAG: oligopeptide:H+ symporter [Betaproteobacteria bacterium]|nr:oligopeptide:H+ symporter [Betaproteobacteria bacterium]